MLSKLTEAEIDWLIRWLAAIAADSPQSELTVRRARSIRRKLLRKVRIAARAAKAAK